MLTPAFSAAIEIHAAPEAVFAYVADPARHGEWSANELRVEPVDDSAVGVGKKYRSHALARGRAFHAEWSVTEFSPPTLFAFSGKDETGRFSHRFVFEKIADGTRVTRTVKFDLSLPQYVFYLATLNRVRLPAAKAALSKLMQQLETQGHAQTKRDRTR